MRLANDIAAIGTAGGDLQPQLEALNDAMIAQADASRAAGEDAETLRENLDGSREALERQLEAMGLSEEEARELADAYGLIPDDIVTTVATAGVDGVLADLAEIEGQLRNLTGDNTFKVARGPGGAGALTFHDGGIVEPMALGGVTGVAPLAPIAQMVPPNTLPQVGDRVDVDEAYIPLDRSRRSTAILLETMRRMGIQPMAGGGVTSGAPTVIPQSVTHESKQSVVIQNINLHGDGAHDDELRRIRQESIMG